MHADAAEILAWLAQLPAPPQACYVVHGEPQAADCLRDRIVEQLGWLCVVPEQLERVRID